MLVCFTLPYAQFPLERGIEGVARAGYKFVGIGWPHQGEDPLGLDPNAPRIQQCRNLCQDSGLTLVVLGRGPVSPSNRADDLKRRIDVAGALGAAMIQMSGVGGFRRFPHEPLPSGQFGDAHNAFVEDLQSAGTHAGKSGVQFALKPHRGNTATASHLARLLPEIDRPAVRACYDPGNVHFYEGIAPEDDFPEIADQTIEIVAKDHIGQKAEANFPIPGEGEIDFRRIFRTAAHAEFTGPVVVERVNSTGGPFTPEEIDDRILRARLSLESLIEGSGLIITQ